MFKTAFSLSLAALVAIAPAAGAQEAAAPETESSEADAPQAEAADPVTTLDTGREVEDDGAYVKATHGDWSLRCFPNETGEDLCQLYQLLTEEGGNPVAEFSLYRIEGTASNIEAGATVAVPLGTLLTEELKISVDDGKAKSYSFSYCTMGGCFARIGLTGAPVEAMERSATAFIEIVPAQAPDQTVRIEASLTGFTAGYAETSALSN